MVSVDCSTADAVEPGSGVSRVCAGSGENGDILRCFAGGQRSGIGQFTADPVTGRWRWTPAVYEIFGYQVGEAQPSWELIRGHIPEPDRRTAQEQYAEACQQVGTFSWSHRIHAADATVRSILVVGDTSARNGDRLGRQLAGYVIDVTDLRLDAARAAGTEAVQRSLEHRAVIEQAKGALMLAYHLDAAAAFSLLAWHSQHSNRKLHTIASTLMASIASNGLPTTNLRPMLDRVLAGPSDRPVHR